MFRSPDGRLANRKFYIDSVVDARIVQNNIGTVQIGLFNTKYQAQLEGGLPTALKAYFDYSLPKEKDQTPITIQVKTFAISELTRLADEYGFADITLEYYHGNDLLFSNKQHLEATNVDVTRLHEENIRTLLKKSIKEFSQSEGLAKLEGRTVEVKSQETLTIVSTTGTITAGNTTTKFTDPSSTVAQYQNQNDVNGKRNALTVGYQIGGYTLLGFDYEIRMLDYIGVHFGAGLSGYNYGINFHTSPKRDSPYFNVSYKDGGFGALSAAGIEYGGKWVLNKKTGFGIFFQYGIVKILGCKQEFADLLFKDGKTPEFMTSMGIGLSW